MNNLDWQLYKGYSYPCFLLDENFNVIQKNEYAEKRIYNSFCRPGVIAGILKNNPIQVDALRSGGCSIFSSPFNVQLGDYFTVIPFDKGYIAMLPNNTSPSQQLLAGEMREALSAIFSVMPVISKKLEDDSEAFTYLEHLKRHSYLALRTVQNFSVFSSLDSEINIKPINLTALLTSICETARTICGNNIQIAFNCIDQDQIIVSANAEILEVAISNLLLNSLTYTSDNNKIEVTLRRLGHIAAISVKDTGKGIKPSALSQVFNPYYSTDPYMDGEPRPGLGLGLSIAMQAATVFGGSCNIESEFGEGTCVTITMPLCDDCEIGFASEPVDYLTNKFSVPYIQLSPICRLPM